MVHGQLYVVKYVLAGLYFFDRIKHNKVDLAFMKNGRESVERSQNELNKSDSSCMSEMCQRSGI